MVYWVWLIVAAFSGALFGIFLVALVAASREDEHTGRKWCEE